MVMYKSPRGRHTLRSRYSIGLLCCGVWLSSAASAWNALGHKVVTQIALDHMTPHARLHFTAYNRALASSHSLLDGSVWLDTLRGPATRQLRAMHYIDLPVSYDGSSLQHIKQKRMNAVFAYQQALIRLSSREHDALERAIALRIVLHVAADLHQPLHTITCVSKQHPRGDRGGNLVPLATSTGVSNLHQYWDQGAGLLVGPATDQHAQRIAKQIEANFPCQLSKADINPMHWVNESHQFAVTTIYPELHKPASVNYRQRAEQQLALAGCRLARVLNLADNAHNDKHLSTPRYRKHQANSASPAIRRT
jgi:hypothetical protein